MQASELPDATWAAAHTVEAYLALQRSERRLLEVLVHSQVGLHPQQVLLEVQALQVQDNGRPSGVQLAAS